ncbi:unnamed protein product [Peniophora sp. CBMAI 1063]|nr:unnamed protein product [Peniophora sp. CBMAI 1063]
MDSLLTFATSYPSQCISPSLLRSLSARGLATLQDFGSWQIPPHPAPALPYVFQMNTPAHQLLNDHYNPIQQARIHTLLDTLSLSGIAYADPSLATPCTVRRLEAEALITALSQYSNTPRLPLADELTGVAASDASCIPATAALHDPRSVTLSVVTQNHALTASLRLFHHPCSILHGEVYALVVAHVLHALLNPTTPTILYSDHQNSVRLISDFAVPTFEPRRLDDIQGRSLYHWLRTLRSSSPLSHRPLQLQSVRAHTADTSSPSRANAQADTYASSSHHLPFATPSLPVPTLTMDTYMPYTPRDGYIEHALVPLITHFLAQIAARPRTFAPARSMSPALYDQHNHPAYPYTRAPNTFSAAVQLYARSSQLATADLLVTHFHDREPVCTYGCTTLPADAHHVFVDCSTFAPLRAQCTADICRETTSLPPQMLRHP